MPMEPVDIREVWPTVREGLVLVKENDRAAMDSRGYLRGVRLVRKHSSTWILTAQKRDSL